MNEISRPSNAEPANGDDRVDNVYPYVGARLRALRIGQGMTQVSVAKLIGVSPQQYQKYEDAQSKCSLTNLMILAEYYGVPMTELLPDQEIKAAPLSEADLLARLVAAYSRLETTNQKLRLVQMVEAVQDLQNKNQTDS